MRRSPKLARWTYHAPCDHCSAPGVELSA